MMAITTNSSISVKPARRPGLKRNMCAPPRGKGFGPFRR
jgi:hypothetical protein